MDISETFHQAFIGVKVEIVADFYQNYVEETMDSRISNNSPASIQGYILDIDDIFFYLGKNPNEVTMALEKDRVMYIEVIEEKSPYDDMLDALPVPKKSEEN